VVKLLLEKDTIHPDPEDNNSQTPLSWAAENGHKAVVMMLLRKNGVDLESKSRNKQKAIIKPRLQSKYPKYHSLACGAVIHPAGKIREQLRRRKDSGGRTPLSWAGIRSITRA
jgi:ankyrin repeat protein